MSTVPIVEAQARLPELVSRVAGQHDRVVVTVRGKPSVVLVAGDDLEGLEETIAVLSNSEAVHALTQSQADIAAGRVETLEQVAAGLAARRERTA